VLPLTYAAGASAQSLGLDGTETYDIAIDDDPSPASPSRSPRGGRTGRR
jgi:aconitase A